MFKFNKGKLTGRVIDGVPCILWHTDDCVFIFDTKDMSFIGIL